MVKKIKEVKKLGRYERDAKRQERSKKVASLVILVIMALSVLGFAFISGGGQLENSNGTSNNFPFNLNAFQNPTTGELYPGAVINNEQFIFLDGVDGYEDFQNLNELGKQIKQNDVLNIYVNSNFTSDDALFVIEQKLFNAFDIASNRVQNLSCETPTLVMTNGFKEEFSNCLVFEAPKGEESRFSDILAYHMVK